MIRNEIDVTNFATPYKLEFSITKEEKVIARDGSTSFKRFVKNCWWLITETIMQHYNMFSVFFLGFDQYIYKIQLQKRTNHIIIISYTTLVVLRYNRLIEALQGRQQLCIFIVNVCLVRHYIKTDNKYSVDDGSWFGSWPTIRAALVLIAHHQSSIWLRPVS